MCSSDNLVEESDCVLLGLVRQTSTIAGVKGKIWSCVGTKPEKCTNNGLELCDTCSIENSFRSIIKFLGIKLAETFDKLFLAKEDGTILSLIDFKACIGKASMLKGAKGKESLKMSNCIEELSASTKDE